MLHENIGEKLLLFIVSYATLVLVIFAVLYLIDSFKAAKFIFIFIAAYIFLSPIVFIYWCLVPSAKRRWWFKNEYFVIGIYIGSFLFCWLILFLGVKSVITFVQDLWTWQWFLVGEDAIESISAFIALLIACFLYWTYASLDKYREENWKEKIRYVVEDTLCS